MREAEWRAFWSERLTPDERLLWVGAPKGGIRLFKGGKFYLLFCWIFSIIFIVMMVNSEVKSPLINSIGAFSALFYFSIGCFLLDAWFRTRTGYALTNQRALIAKGVFDRFVYHHYIDHSTQTYLGERDNATISFSPPEPVSIFWRSRGRFPGTSNNAFEFLADRPAVLKLINDIKAGKYA